MVRTCKLHTARPQPNRDLNQQPSRLSVVNIVNTLGFSKLLISEILSVPNHLKVPTSEEHLLQQVVDLGHPKEFDELDLLDHLPGDAL